MSKRKGVSAEEKKTRLQQLFYEKKEFFQLKVIVVTILWSLVTNYLFIFVWKLLLLGIRKNRAKGKGNYI